ncbi:ExbD/TolR family protein [Ralstonia wenshanensis]|uniref:Biopolymer transport protein ExbD n=1 Tax=Ralstonia wenshanensis TaxID=2842456 RepID=A0AAD2EVA5_9RALS|nr:biopolymer transporter ExbD [Ralstonia wenshanensis]CAJ0704754.1 Biopolymer transport protein ExbD [Ralstonia wenshanensis]
MSFGSFDSDDEVMSEINMTPLVDVMLVLLIIFIITIPVINHAVKIDLPRASNKPDDAKPQSVNVEINADGQVFWNNQPVDEATLQADIAQAAQQQQQPEMHLRADRNVRYERVAQVMASIQRGGLSRIGFVTEPQH